MHAVTLSELVARGDPFWIHHVDRRSFATAWADGDAVAVLFSSRTGGRRLIGLGPAADLAPLLARVAEVEPRPTGVSIAGEGAVAIPWPLAARRVWAWMLCDTPPPEPELRIVELTDADAVNAVLDAGNPDSFARPGDPDVECWLGACVDGVPASLGAITRVGDGTGYLRGITTLPAYRGRGLAAAVTAALTRRAMTRTGVATLGVYVDNEPALAVYRRLGYRTVHTFTSGPTVH